MFLKKTWTYPSSKYRYRREGKQLINVIDTLDLKTELRQLLTNRRLSDVDDTFFFQERNFCKSCLTKKSSRGEKKTDIRKLEKEHLNLGIKYL